MQYHTRIFLLLLLATLSAAQALADASGKRLNNLVTELLRVESMAEAGPATLAVPRNGWVYFRVEAATPGESFVELLDADAAPETVLLRKDSAGNSSGESMRWMTAGEHHLRFHTGGAARLDTLVARTMPETHFVRFPQEPHYPELGVFDWEWLHAHVLSSVNTLVGTLDDRTSPMIDAWTGSGRKFIAYGSLPHAQDLTGEAAFDYWWKNPGFQDPRLSGMIADEFNGRQNPLYPAWIEGMRVLGDRAGHSNKAFYGYCGGPGMYSRPEARELVRTVFDSGFYMAWERYHHEMPTLEEANAFMDALLGKEMGKWREVFPECQRQMVLVLGIFAAGPELDVQPQVNYKVWMDMQMRYLATHPLFDGLFGVHWWYSGGASEETLRWQSALYRHYCIEGATEPLSDRFGWAYMLDHLQNPDFHEGLDGWVAEPAAEGAIKPGYLEYYARIQNRYWQREVYPDDPAGNTYLWMKRDPGTPNRISQEIRNLVPGRLYTVQMISADYQDVLHGRSEKKQHAVSMIVDGAETVPGGTYLAVPVSSPWSHERLPFKNGPAWFNHHRVMFRATAPTARLTITDRAAPGVPEGPADQELMLNYFQLQPYFEE